MNICPFCYKEYTDQINLADHMKDCEGQEEEE